jgi:hypothetical protein
VAGPLPVINVSTGETFVSLEEAGRSIGRRGTEISKAITLGHRCGGHEWRFAQKPTPPRIGHGSGRKRPVRRLDTGQCFPSAQEASLSLGTGSATLVWIAIAMGRRCDGTFWEYLDSPVDPEPVRRGTRILCVETRIVYDSASAAGKALFVSGSAIGNAARTGKTCLGYHWRRI